MMPSLKLSGLLKPSVTTNVTASRPVRTEVVRKFTDSTGPGITAVCWLRATGLYRFKGTNFFVRKESDWQEINLESFLLYGAKFVGAVHN